MRNRIDQRKQQVTCVSTKKPVKGGIIVTLRNSPDPLEEIAIEIKVKNKQFRLIINSNKLDYSIKS